MLHCAVLGLRALLFLAVAGLDQLAYKLVAAKEAGLQSLSSPLFFTNYPVSNTFVTGLENESKTLSNTFSNSGRHLGIYGGTYIELNENIHVNTYKEHIYTVRKYVCGCT